MDILSILKNSLLSIVSSIVRTLLVSLLTWLSTRNLIDSSTSSQLVAILPIASSAIIWSLIERFIISKLHLEKIITALNLPEGSTQETLNDALKQKNTPTT